MTSPVSRNRLLLALALGLLAAASTASAAVPYAYVGTLDAFDNATRELKMTGPDGEPRALKLDGMVLREGEGAIREPLPDVTPYVGRRIGAVLRDEKTIHLLTIAPATIPEPLYGQVTSVDDERDQVHFTSDGVNPSFRPAVNMLARKTAGGSPEPASWDWFESMIGKNVKVVTITVNLQELIWSVEPWDPVAEPLPADE